MTSPTPESQEEVPDLWRDRFAALPSVTGPSFERVSRGPARVRRAAPLVGLVAVAAGALWVAVPASGPVQRDRGAAPPPPRVRLEAAAEGPDGLRPLRDGDVVAGFERVLFRVATPDGGALRVDESGTAIWTGEVGIGASAVGDGSSMAWRPDGDGVGPRVYEATLCGPGGCAGDRLVLTWAP